MLITSSISKWEWMIFSFILLLLGAGIIGSYISTDWYDHTFAVEDGFIEWMTVASLLFTSFTAIRYLVKKQPKSYLFIACMIGIFLLCIFAAGEEISWGQRLFQIASSEYFIKNNSQAETNIHNLVVDGEKLNKIIFTTVLGIVAGIYLLVIPILHRMIQPVRNFLDHSGVPVAKPMHVFIIICIALLHLLVRSQIGKQPELLEFGVCAMFFVIVAFPYNAYAFSNRT